MDYGRYVGRPGAASPLVDFENGRLIGNHQRDTSMDHDLLQIDVSYGLSARLTLVGALPLMNRRSHGHYDYRPVDSEGIVHEHGPIPPQWVLSTDEIVHNENGLGDVQLGATYAVLWSARESLVARAIVELPTGCLPRRGRVRLHRPSRRAVGQRIDRLRRLAPVPARYRDEWLRPAGGRDVPHQRREPARLPVRRGRLVRLRPDALLELALPLVRAVRLALRERGLVPRPERARHRDHDPEPGAGSAGARHPALGALQLRQDPDRREHRRGAARPDAGRGDRRRARASSTCPARGCGPPSSSWRSGRSGSPRRG